ncbi:hypothetical protein VTN00DRAFT_9748 [Thermoascus crustaceus]|uniref:uncharacterized protein n=1 Tax=Thermoascus crustaceus TaxID=5088 RepID=UPI0037421E8A
MPTLQSGDRIYRVSFSDVFKSSKTLREEQLAHAALRRERAAKKAAAEKEAAEKAAAEREAAQKAAAEKAAADMAAAEKFEKACGTRAPTRPVFIPVVAQTSIPSTLRTPKGSSESATDGTFVWTPELDARLTELKNVNTPWISISIAMDNRPIAELKKRWNLLRAADVELERKTAATKKTKFGYERWDSEEEEEEEDSERRRYERKLEEKPKRRVSFSDPLVIPGKAKSISLQTDKPLEPPKHKDKGKDAKKVYYYLDNEFTLEEIVLLHNLADRYEKEKWLRISSRFYDKTGKRITPDQAKSRIQRD